MFYMEETVEKKKRKFDMNSAVHKNESLAVVM